MNRIAVVILLSIIFCFTSSGFAAGKQAAHKSIWRVEKKIDKMTDKTECRLDSPSKNILLSFQGNQLYLVSGHPIGVEAMGGVEIRVDKNPSFTVLTRIIHPHMAAILNQEDVQKIASQFNAGSSYFLRLLTLQGVEEDQATLKGFKDAYDEWKLCGS